MHRTAAKKTEVVAVCLEVVLALEVSEVESV